MKLYASLAALALTAACAGTSGLQNPVKGPLDYAAMQQLYPQMSIVQFNQLDRNGDGLIDDGEMQGISQFAPMNQNGIINSELPNATIDPATF